MTPELKSLQRRIESLEKEVASLKGKPTIPNNGKRKPVNNIAFDQAMIDMCNGNRKSLDRYMELYSIPAS
jgi:hypothetical protein